MAEKGLQIKMIPIVSEKPFGNIPRMFSLLHNAVRDQAAEGVRFMSVYPTKSGSNYKRTGTLRKSWSFVIKTGGRLIEGIIGSNSNIAPYNEEVQGVNQDEIFATLGWRNVNDLGKVIDKEFPKRIQEMIGRAL